MDIQQYDTIQLAINIARICELTSTPAQDVTLCMVGVCIDDEQRGDILDVMIDMGL